MKSSRSLPNLLKLTIAVEISAFVIIQFADIESLVESDGSAFAYFWHGLWYPLAALWVVGWIGLLKNWTRSFEIYALGLIAGIVYYLLSGPTAYSAGGGFLSHVTSLAAGATLTLAWLRKSGIGDWTQRSEELPALPVRDSSAPL